MILWVDDDIFSSLNPHIDELEDYGYKVLKADSLEEMWSHIDDNNTDIYLIIMDIMMPTGPQSQDTNNRVININKAKGGILTGLRVLEDLNTKGLLNNKKVLIFTILGEQEITEWSKKNKVKSMRKQETTPFKLLDTIKSMGIKKDD
jgi:CheY-like chemotaxis protein